MRLLRLKRTWFILLLPLSFGLVQLAGSHSSLTERFYSSGLYPLLAGLFGRLTSLVPFSLAQWLIFLAPLLLLSYITYCILCSVRDRTSLRDHLSRMTGTLLCALGCGYFLFVFLCGFNYHRESFAAYSGLHVRPSSAQELAALCEELLEKANRLREVVSEDEFGVMTLSSEHYHDTAALAQEFYLPISEDYPALGGHTVLPKPVAFSRVMSYLDITGIYVAFTFEANVNVNIPDYWIPSTMMHELAHSKGFMREDEANFISYLACSASGNPEFEYSGTVLALVHSTNALYATDKELYWQIRERYCEGLNRDMEANYLYWKQFEGPVAQVSTTVNDVYLKSNRQEQGVKSYGRMVDLLLADYRQRHTPVSESY